MKNSNFVRRSSMWVIICIGIILSVTSCRKNTVQTPEDTSRQTAESASERTETGGDPIDSYESIIDDNAIPDDLADLGIIKKENGTLYYPPNKCIEDSWAFRDIFDRIGRKHEFFNDVTRISVGQAVIELKSDDKKYMTKLSAYGQEKVFDEPMFLDGNFGLYVLQFDGTFIMGYAFRGTAPDFPGGGYKIIFTENGILELDKSDESEEGNFILNTETGLLEPNSCIGFEYRDDGKIGYVRIPSKYIGCYSLGDHLDNCVARDDFYREVGYAEIEDGKIVYYPEETFLVLDYFDLDKEFYAVKKWYADNNEFTDPYSEFKTLDEIMERNMKTYARAK